MNIDFNSNHEVEFSFGDINSDGSCTELYKLNLKAGVIPEGVSLKSEYSYSPTITAAPGAWLDSDTDIELDLIRKDLTYDTEAIPDGANSREVPYYEMKHVGDIIVATATFTIKAFTTIIGSNIYTPTNETGTVPHELLSCRTRYTGSTREIQYFYGVVDSAWSADIDNYTPTINATYLKSFARRGILPRSIYINATATNYWSEIACDNEIYFQFYYEKVDGYFIRGRRRPIALINNEQLFGDWQAPALRPVSGTGVTSLSLSNTIVNYSLFSLAKETITNLFTSYSGAALNILAITPVKGEVYLDKEIVVCRATSEAKVEMIVEVSDGMSTMHHVVTVLNFSGEAEYVSPVADRTSSNDYDILWRAVVGSYFSNSFGGYTSTITIDCPYSDVSTNNFYVISGDLNGGLGSSAYLTAVDGSANGLMFLVEYVAKGTAIGQGVMLRSGNSERVMVDSEKGATNFIDWFEAEANVVSSKVLDLTGISTLHFHTSFVGGSPDFSRKELHLHEWDASSSTVTLNPHPDYSSRTRVVITGE
jgi:hypothetical protein